jgi:hypothetical protein
MIVVAGFIGRFGNVQHLVFETALDDDSHLRELNGQGAPFVPPPVRLGKGSLSPSLIAQLIVRLIAPTVNSYGNYTSSCTSVSSLCVS